MHGGKEQSPDLPGPDAGPHADNGARPATTAWASALTLGLFAVGAAILGIGIVLALGVEAQRAWEAVSLLLLGLALMLMSWATRREALGRPVGWGLRITVSGLALTAAAIHFLLV